MRDLRDRLKEGLDTLSVLSQYDSDRLQGLKAFKTFFCTSYFDGIIAQLEKEKQEATAVKSAGLLTTSGVQPQKEVIKRGGEGSYACASWSR